jgi:uncharacterized membrane protein YcaP (DUF421 family)
MDSVIRGAVVYLFILLVFRIAGKRALSEITTFDLVLTLIISEAIQHALIDNDHSMTNAFLIVITLVGLDILLSLLKERSDAVAKAIDDTPVLILRDGELLSDRMKKERVDEADILEAAREQEGIERLEEVKYAILERGGHITVVPKRSA